MCVYCEMGVFLFDTSRVSRRSAWSPANQCTRRVPRERYRLNLKILYGQSFRLFVCWISWSHKRSHECLTRNYACNSFQGNDTCSAILCRTFRTKISMKEKLLVLLSGKGWFFLIDLFYMGKDRKWMNEVQQIKGAPAYWLTASNNV